MCFIHDRNHNKEDNTCVAFSMFVVKRREYKVCLENLKRRNHLGDSVG